MLLSYTDYIEKMHGCWMGKTIGGTLGAPFECYRGVFDVDFYTQDLTKGPVPNDDLDLQIAWLNAVEKFGDRVDAQILAEYWLMYVTPYWCEYGAGKNNVRRGFQPPLSGYLNNLNRDSCGCFIRSEIWACLAPGLPAVAAKYALEDAIVDHSNEGVYAEVFCAAMQSAAFVESNLNTIVDIGLSYIPQDSAIYKVVIAVRDFYNQGKDWKACRMMILQDFPGTFGEIGGYWKSTEKQEDYPVARAGWDAPSNIGITVLGLFYGEGDFEKSICLATNCGEDADCTAGTLAALMGIISGISGLPAKWVDPIGDSIATICLSDVEAGEFTVSKTVSDLTRRVARQLPRFLGPDRCNCIDTDDKYFIVACDGDALYNKDRIIGYYRTYTNFLDQLKLQPFCVKYESPMVSMAVDYTEPPYIGAGSVKKIRLHFVNNFMQQQWFNINWHLPQDCLISPSKNMTYSLEQWHTNDARLTVDYEITLPETLESEKYELLADISFVGRATRVIVPVTFICTQVPDCDKEDMRWEDDQ